MSCKFEEVCSCLQNSSEIDRGARHLIRKVLHSRVCELQFNFAGAQAVLYALRLETHDDSDLPPAQTVEDHKLVHPAIVTKPSAVISLTDEDLSA